MRNFCENDIIECELLHRVANSENKEVQSYWFRSELLSNRTVNKYDQFGGLQAPTAKYTIKSRNLQHEIAIDDEIVIFGEKLKVISIEYDFKALGLLLSPRFSIEHQRNMAPKIIQLGG